MGNVWLQVKYKVILAEERIRILNPDRAECHLEAFKGRIRILVTVRTE